MGKARMCVTAIVLVLLGLPAFASAATVTGVHARILPIPGFPGTGDMLGAGAEVEIEGRLEGDELPGGLPSQTRKLVVYFPAGTKIDSAGLSDLHGGQARTVRSDRMPQAVTDRRWHGGRG